jgi:hypothetical protein
LWKSWPWRSLAILKDGFTRMQEWVADAIDPCPIKLPSTWIPLQLPQLTPLCGTSHLGHLCVCPLKQRHFPRAFSWSLLSLKKSRPGCVGELSF